jgi:hypothetical protein
VHPDELEGHDTVNLRYHGTGHALRWPFGIGDRVTENVPPSGIVVDVSDALVATFAAGGGIEISATFIAAPYVARGELVPVLPDFAVERHNTTGALTGKPPRQPCPARLPDDVAASFSGADDGHSERVGVTAPAPLSENVEPTTAVPNRPATNDSGSGRSTRCHRFVMRSTAPARSREATADRRCKAAPARPWPAPPAACQKGRDDATADLPLARRRR